MTDDLDTYTTDDQADATAKAERKVQGEIDDLKWLMAHKQGRRVAYKLLGDTGIYRNPYNHSGSITAYNCGAMNVGQQFLARIMEHAPESYTMMCKEQRNDE